MSPEREEKFRKVVSRRQSGLTIILENVHDAHNIGAVLRSCDSVGVKEIFVLYTEPQLNEEYIALGKRSSSGARKWVDVNYYTDAEACMRHVKRDYGLILSTHLGENPRSLYELDLTQSIALLFGNERDGVSDDLLAYSDGNFIIPQMGMVKSLNISVACGVSLYEAYRQRKAKDFYGRNNPMSPSAQEALLREYIRRHETKDKRKNTRRRNV